MDNIKALKKALKGKTTDGWELGTVIRWTAAGHYSYAALKTAIGWVTTARWNNGFVPKTVTYDELVEILSRSETTDVAVATEWASI
jgi:hypothetical protein